MLPPHELLKYDNLPSSIKGQILDDYNYDLYGRAGLAFDDTYIDGPVGKAAKDYTYWIDENPEISKELQETVKTNWIQKYPELTWEDYYMPATNGDDWTIVPVSEGVIDPSDIPPPLEPIDPKPSPAPEGDAQGEKDPWWKFNEKDW